MSVTIHLQPELPCGVLAPTDIEPRRRCGQPAAVATAEQVGNGHWLILPMCRTCVEAMARAYGIRTPEDLTRRTV